MCVSSLLAVGVRESREFCGCVLVVAVGSVYTFSLSVYTLPPLISVCAVCGGACECVCVCVCVRERERESIDGS